MTSYECIKYYRSQSVKPALPESARRYKVQAEAAFKEKNYDRAIDLYERGLREAPWWPEGRFNRAMLLSEIKEYEEAIEEMKKYLQLVPDAPDARQAQDKIYEREGMAR